MFHCLCIPNSTWSLADKKDFLQNGVTCNIEVIKKKYKGKYVKEKKYYALVYWKINSKVSLTNNFLRYINSWLVLYIKP